jgi:hypothetical protein
LNLIRFVPAKGQDASMQTSVYLAKLIGPVFVAIGAGMLWNARVYQDMAHDFIRNQSLIYLSGLLAMPVGLAIVLAHNVWTPDWRVVITVIGWLAVIGGALRIALPQRVQTIGGALVGNNAAMKIGSFVVLALGLVLCFTGYIAVNR